MSRNTLSQYVWLADKIYRIGKISLRQINEDRLRDGYDIIPERTFHKWKNAIEDMFGISINCEKKGDYRYYIDNRDDFANDKLRKWLFDTIATSNLISENKNLKDLILVEDIPSAHSFLNVIIDAIKNKRRVVVEHKSFENKEASSTILNPYCVKLNRQRWYLVGWSEEKGIRTYGLDRIKSVKIIEDTFTDPVDFDPEVYFDGCVGVFVDRKISKQHVKVKIDHSQANYLRTLKIHDSQQETLTNKDYSIFEFDVRPTIDFIQELLKYGEELEILAPQTLRDEVKEKVKQMYKLYVKE